MAFLFHDDLQQHGAGQILARLGVFNANIGALAHHLRHFRQADVGGSVLVVELAAGVAAQFDGFGFAHLGISVFYLASQSRTVP